MANLAKILDENLKLFRTKLTESPAKDKLRLSPEYVELDICAFQL